MKQKDIEQYFVTILADYQKGDVTYCTYTDFEFSTIGKNSALATMDWKMMKKDGIPVTSWRESYVLIMDNSYFNRPLNTISFKRYAR